MEIAQWYYSMAKGKIVGCVLGNENPERVLKYLRTLVKKGEVTPDQLDEMIAEVERETVEPFLRSPWNQPERGQRFQDFIQGLTKIVEKEVRIGTPRESDENH